MVGAFEAEGLDGLPGDVFQGSRVGAVGGADEPGFPALDDPLGAAVGFPGSISGLADRAGEFVLGQVEPLPGLAQGGVRRAHALRVGLDGTALQLHFDACCDALLTPSGTSSRQRQLTSVRGMTGPASEAQPVPQSAHPLGALTTYELNRYRRELERALKGLGVGVPARRLVQDKLAQVLAEQDSRARLQADRQPNL